jgi:hypothetical protein
MFDRIVKRKHLIIMYDGFREVSLFLGKRQDLRGALARYIAVKRSKIRVKQSEESRKQQHRILGRLAKCFRLFHQQTCSLRGRHRFRRGLPFDMLEWVYQCNLQLDFFATKRRRAVFGSAMP